LQHRLNEVVQQSDRLGRIDPCISRDVELMLVLVSIIEAILIDFASFQTVKENVFALLEVFIFLINRRK